MKLAYNTSQSQAIDNETELIEVATEIMKVTKNESDLMNAEDVKKTTDIIDNLLLYNSDKEESTPKLNEKVCCYRFSLDDISL